MQDVTRQLEQVRRRGRLLLVAQRLCQWLSVLIPILLALALVDFVLRLPSVVRLVVGLLVAAGALLWIATRLARAVRFMPSLPSLALRAEKMYPQLEGKLASAVEFHLHQSEMASQPRAAALARTSVSQTQQLLDGLSLTRLIDPARTLRFTTLCVVVAAMLGIAVLANPSGAHTAVMRWVSPLGEAQWPKRYSVAAVTPQTTWPIDNPLPLQATVAKGYYNGMRVHGMYRIVEAGTAGDWQEVLLNEQANGNGSANATPRFERLVDLPAMLSRTLTGPTPGRAHLEFYFEAGDDRTPIQTVRLAARPAVTSATAHLTPPAYATGLQPARTVNLHEQTGQVASASALAGSSLELSLDFNKPIVTQDAHTLLPGLANVAGLDVTLSDDRASTRITLPLHKSVQTPIQLGDRHGLANLSQRSYRIEAIEDKAPAVSLTTPVSDQSVLPSAVIEIAALAQDDVGVEELLIEGQTPHKAGSGSDQTASTLNLARKTARQPTLEARHTLDLSKLELEPGDEVTLTAVARDVYNLLGMRHKPVISAPRKIHIIDEAELTAQLRADLAGVRQQAVRLDQSQGQTQGQKDVPRAISQQDQIGRRLLSQDEQIDRLEQRVQHNRLDDPALTELMRRARELLNAANQSSDQAEGKLREAEALQQEAEQLRQRSDKDAALQDEADRARTKAEETQREAQAADQLAKQMAQLAQAAQQQQAEDAAAQQEAATQAADQAAKLSQRAQAAARQAEAAQQRADAANPQAAKKQQASGQAQADARQRQQQVRQSLQELADMLDQGANALALQQELNEITREQEGLSEQTRKLLPRTAGLDRQELPEDLRQQLDEITQRQKELARQAGEFARDARAAARSMRNQGETDQERAMAETLDEVADIAESRGLEQDMEEAAQQAAQNQLSQAGGAQADAQQTLSRMSEAMSDAQQKQQELLKRRLAKLEQLLQNLIERQKAQLAALDAVAEPNAAQRLPEMAPAQTAVRQATMAAEAEARTDPKTAPAAQIIGKAIDAQARAVIALRDAKRAPAVRGEKDAVTELEKALEQIKEQQQQQQQDEQRKQREELRKAYEQLARRETALRGQVAELAGKPRMTRRDQAKLRTLGNEQGAIRNEARELKKQIEDTLVFELTHRRIDATTARAAEALLQAEADDLVLLDQRQAAALLQAMADALKEEQPDDKFETPPGEEAGGGGGGGGGEQPLVPDIAELKLLKSAQQAIYDETRALSDALPQPPGRRMTQRIEDLGAIQRELHETGKAFIEKISHDEQPPSQDQSMPDEVRRLIDPSEQRED